MYMCIYIHMLYRFTYKYALVIPMKTQMEEKERLTLAKWTKLCCISHFPPTNFPFLTSNFAFFFSFARLRGFGVFGVINCAHLVAPRIWRYRKLASPRIWRP